MFTGPLSLQKAMLEELTALGYRFTNARELKNETCQLVSNKNSSDTKAGYQELTAAWGEFKGIDYKIFQLPNDWHNALKYAKDALEYWDICEIHKDGSYVKIGFSWRRVKEGDIVRILSHRKDSKGVVCYSIETIDGEFKDEGFHFSHFRKATRDEIIGAFSKVLNNKGYIANARIKSMRHEDVVKVTTGEWYMYHDGHDQVWLKTKEKDINILVYEKGKWAEIVPKEITKNIIIQAENKDITITVQNDGWCIAYCDGDSEFLVKDIQAILDFKSGLPWDVEVTMVNIGCCMNVERFELRKIVKAYNELQQS